MIKPWGWCKMRMFSVASVVKPASWLVVRLGPAPQFWQLALQQTEREPCLTGAGTRYRLPGLLMPLYQRFMLALGILLILQSCMGDLDIPATVRIDRDHHEVTVNADSSLTLRVLSHAKPIGLCLEVPPGTDTSQWEARLSLGNHRDPRGFAPPKIRLGRFLYFEMDIPEDLKPGVELELGGILTDQYDGTRYRLPRRQIRFEDGIDYQQLLKRKNKLVEELMASGIMATLPALDELIRETGKRGFPLLTIRLNIMVAEFLTGLGTPDALNQARKRLENIPAWLGRPECGYYFGLVANVKANIENRPGGNLSRARNHLIQAERWYRRILHPQLIGPITTHADLLARLGNVEEGLNLLRAGLAECDQVPCQPTFLAYAQRQLAWLILQSSDAGEDGWREAVQRLGNELQAGETDPVELANFLVNIANLKLLQGENPLESLAEARGFLGKKVTNNQRTSLISGWADLVEGLHFLLNKDPKRCLALCEPLVEHEDPRLRARALSAVGRSFRIQGQLARASAAFELAILHHRSGYQLHPGQRLALGSGEQADDFARAARTALEMGGANRAWHLLAEIDRFAVDTRERHFCSEKSANPMHQARWEEHNREIEILLQQLLALQSRSTENNKAEIEGIKKQLRLSFLDWPACREMVPARPFKEPDFRAVALEDEILLLNRKPDGTYVLDRRTPMSRQELRRLLSQVRDMLNGQDRDDTTWRLLLEPLEAALVPRDFQSLGAVTTFGLHGLLQGVPMAALPLPQRDSSRQTGPRWLGEVTVVALQPACVPTGSPPLSEGRRMPLFVVDPLGDLAHGSRLYSFYQQRFPQARILHREEADLGALRQWLSGASWLHVDAHGYYDPTFPELSGFKLRDGLFHLGDPGIDRLADTLRFVNLSGCQTGSWPITADSGRYGMTGLFTRLGAAWAIGSRSDLSDALAGVFNRAFYQVFDETRSVPFAYAKAMADVRKRFPASGWATLMLLRGDGLQVEN